MCYVCEMEGREKKPTNYTGRLYKVYAYENGALIGSGYVIVDDYSGAHEPTLNDFKGENLNPGMYEIRISEDMPQFVVVNGSKH